MGRISKKMLENIVDEIKIQSELNLWKNDQSVLSWFSTIEKNKSSKFIQFDIESFYPSITKELLGRALDYAQSIVNIDQTKLDIIQHSRKSLLFSGSECWIKKNDELFDVTMGAFDGAEVCELVGLYLLKKIKNIIPPSHVGLYRDDGLAVITDANGPKIDKIKKKLHRCFKDENLKIVVNVNMVKVDFLDIHLNIETGITRPFKKPNNTLQYIHKDSNHPKNIKKNIPEMIGKRLSSLSSTRQIFEEEKMPYEEALKQSGYSTSLSYDENTRQPKKKNRRRKIIWFNPPFSQSVETNVGREFRNILTRNFPVQHKYHKIFNKNTVKLSYSCMPNIGNIIKSHNASILNIDKAQENLKECSCRNKDSCPLDNNCLTKSLIYQANLSCDNDENFKYIGLVEGDFKKRYNNHNMSFRNERYANSTELSKKFWDLKNEGMDPKVSWKILKIVKSYKNGQKCCQLCLTEKLFIIKCRDKNLLNSRSEISSKCRHKRKFLLSKV